jgi:hypothetical protein
MRCCQDVFARVTKLAISPSDTTGQAQRRGILWSMREGRLIITVSGGIQAATVTARHRWCAHLARQQTAETPKLLRGSQLVWNAGTNRVAAGRTAGGCRAAINDAGGAGGPGVMVMLGAEAWRRAGRSTSWGWVRDGR